MSISQQEPYPLIILRHELNYGYFSIEILYFVCSQAMVQAADGKFVCKCTSHPLPTAIFLGNNPGCWQQVCKCTGNFFLPTVISISNFFHFFMQSSVSRVLISNVCPDPLANRVLSNFMNQSISYMLFVVFKIRWHMQNICYTFLLPTIFPHIISYYIPYRYRMHKTVL